jgi:ubiquitin carboxyl-terminal hydrolase 7
VFPDAHHRFVAEECDWGFTRFSELRKLFTVQDGHSRATIEGESAEVSVFVRVLEDPTGVLWHNFVKCASEFSLPLLSILTAVQL